MDARRRAFQSRQARKADTRRKILLGAIVLARLEQGRLQRKDVNAWLDEALTRADDRALFDLPSSEAKKQWAQLRFTFHPSLQRLTLWWNVPQLWQALTEDTARPAASLAAEPLEWLLWRQDLSSYFRSLPQTEAAALDGALRGWPFGELCELLCTELGEAAAPAPAATLLRGWVASGLIVSAA